MIQLTREIPDVNVLLGLPTQDLALKILFLVRQRGDAMFHREALQGEMWNAVFAS
jgi:hypothetical protein